MFVEGSARGQMKDRNLLSVQTGIPRLNVFLPFSRPEPLGESQICLLCLSLCSYIQSMRSALRIISKHCHQFTWMHWNKFYVYSIQYLWYVYIYKYSQYNYIVYIHRVASGSRCRSLSIGPGHVTESQPLQKHHLLRIEAQNASTPGPRPTRACANYHPKAPTAK